MFHLTIAPEVARIAPLLLALFAPTTGWTKYWVQLTKPPFDRIKGEPAHSSAIRLYTLAVGAVSMLALTVFFGEAVSVSTWRALAVALAAGAAAGGAAMADYHMSDFLRSLPFPDFAALVGSTPIEPPVVPPAPPTT